MTSRTSTPIYINGAAQISVVPPAGNPLTARPLPYDIGYQRAADPDFSSCLRPAESRRMGLILKRAVFVAESALHEAGISCPDAIVTGTGLGCVESTERFLDTLCQRGESLLSPTHFMQSTHNTIGSLIAIRTKCHGYNATFSHRGISFDSALHNARLLLQSGRAATALAGGFDEVTPTYYELLRRSGYVGNDLQYPCSEAAAAFVLTRESGPANLCRLAGTAILHRPDRDRLISAIDALCRKANMCRADVDAVMTFEDGTPRTENFLLAFRLTAMPRAVMLHYKHIFGECYSASALGFYAAVRAIHSGRMPKAMMCEYRVEAARRPLRSLLFLNHCSGKDFAVSLLLSPQL